MSVKWTRTALDNLDAAVEFIAADKPVAAANVASKIWNAVEQLAYQPGVGRPGRIGGTRELIIPGLPFVILYAVKEGPTVSVHQTILWLTAIRLLRLQP